MDRRTLLAVGTPLLDTLYGADYAFLRRHGLAPGSSNFVDAQALADIEETVRTPPVLEAAGDNARNMAEGFAILERARGREPPSVAYAGRLGPDRDGGLFEESLRAVGVEPLLEKLAPRTGRILCFITPDKQRTFAVYLGQSEEYAPAERLPTAEWLYVSSISALCKGRLSATCLELIRRQKGAEGGDGQEGGPGLVALSMESPGMLAAHREKAVALAGQADVLFMNEEEAVALGLGMEAIAHLAPVVFLKRGAGGSTVYERGRRSGDVPARPIQHLIDTTGAGDAYAAGAVWGLSRGKGALESARIGSELGAAVVQKLGAGLPPHFELAR